MVQSHSPTGVNVCSHDGALAPPGEWIELVHPSAHPSPQPKRQMIDKLLPGKEQQYGPGTRQGERE